MTIKDIKSLAYYYRNTNDAYARLNIIRKVWSCDKQEGIKTLSNELDLDYHYLYQKGKIERLNTKRNRIRRQRSRQMVI